MRGARLARRVASTACLLGALTTVVLAQDRVPYASGGVGLNSREELVAREDEFSLKLVFAEKGAGAYLANVGVRISDPGGRTLLDATADGPWFYAKLPAGTYRVTATFEGVSRSIQVQVPPSGLKVEHLRWGE
jgi:hypothetical protein